MVDAVHGAGGRDDGGEGSRRVRVEPRLTTLGQLRVMPAPGAAADAGGRSGDSTLPSKALVDIGGEHCRVSGRFWKSVFARYRFGSSTFRYFQPEEVFRRICEVSRDDQLRVMVEYPRQGPPTALAVSKPTDRLVTIDDVRDLARSHGARQSHYGDGVVSCTFTPRSGEQALAIGGDQFANRFTLDVPIDGYGGSRIHVALLRMVCSNGAIGYHKAFCSEVPASRSPRHTLQRAIECFDHADGFAAIRERFLAAQSSWASVREAHTLYRQLVKTKVADPIRKTRAVEDFDRLTGRIQEFYGLTNLDTLPARRQRLLPVKCRVYDLINFASEVATHVAEPADSRLLQSWIGSTLAEEFDLEGTADQAKEFADLLLEGGATGVS
jgi:hypothetical protein